MPGSASCALSGKSNCPNSELFQELLAHIQHRYTGHGQQHAGRDPRPAAGQPRPSVVPWAEPNLVTVVPAKRLNTAMSTGASPLRIRRLGYRVPPRPPQPAPPASGQQTRDPPAAPPSAAATRRRRDPAHDRVLLTSSPVWHQASHPGADNGASATVRLSGQAVVPEWAGTGGRNLSARIRVSRGAPGSPERSTPRRDRIWKV